MTEFNPRAHNKANSKTPRMITMFESMLLLLLSFVSWGSPPSSCAVVAVGGEAGPRRRWW